MDQRFLCANMEWSSAVLWRHRAGIACPRTSRPVAWKWPLAFGTLIRTFLRWTLVLEWLALAAEP
jgi:hypothetical protein